MGWVWVLLAGLGLGAGVWWYSYSHPSPTTQPAAAANGAAPPTDTTATTGGASANTGNTAVADDGKAPLEKVPALNMGGKGENKTDGNAPSVKPPPAQTHAKTEPAHTGPATTTGAAAQLAAGMKLIEDGKMVQGRKALSKLLAAGVWDEPHATTAPDGGEGHGSSALAGIGTDTLSEDDAQTIRDTLASINRTLIFSTKYIKDDPLVDFHKVEAGEVLSKITPRYNVPYQTIEVINNTVASKIRAGQNLKMIRGPFHAVVSKREYRLDLYLKDPADGAMLYIRSFRVGLGESDSTPPGSWIIKRDGKVANPQWSNPKTGEFFHPGDPKNPIGKYWLALDGTDEFTKTKKGFGIHGTVDPDSIGKQASMGCVRLADADIELVYKLLSGGASTVLILP